jgi:hypothetical protein
VAALKPSEQTEWLEKAAPVKEGGAACECFYKIRKAGHVWDSLPFGTRE